MRKDLPFLGLLLMLCGVVLCADRAGATIYYVSVSGLDTNPGSISQPWRTIQKAANTLAPGDTALVRSGTYNERITMNVSGSQAGGYVTFQAYPGEVPVVDGTGLTPPAYESALFWLIGNSYVTISGFELRNYITSAKNAVPAGIYVEGAAHDLQIIGNKIHAIENDYNGVAANAFGMAFYGTSGTQAISNVVVCGNEIYKLKTGSSETMTFNGNVSGVTVANNLVHDNLNIGIDFIGFEGTCPTASLDQARNALCRGNVVWNIDTTGNPAYKTSTGYDPSADGIYVDGGMNITIERNLVSTCDLGIEVSSEHATHYASYVAVRDNFVHHCLATGISTGGYNRNVGWAQNCTFTNNTLYDNDTLAQGNGELELQYNVTNCTFKQNILYAGSQDLLMSNAYAANSGNTVDYNVYYTLDGQAVSQWQWKNVTKTGFAAYKTASGNDVHSQFVDPQFIATGTAPNLHLQPTSPAIDVGDPAFVSGTGELDFDSGLRVVNNVVDIGGEEMSALEKWRFNHFSATQLADTTISGDLADPDGDGMANLMEYAFGTSPAVPGSTPVGVGLTSGTLQIYFPRQLVATDVTYHVQASGDLTNWAEIWTSGTAPYLGGTNASVIQVVPDVMPISGTGRRFMRLNITKP